MTPAPSDSATLTDSIAGGVGIRDLFGVPNVVQSDIVLTPDHIAKAVVDRFKPSGRVLDPCKGDGAFLRHMPGAEWCEIREGRCFYDWKERVDWIVSNPPYSIFSEFLRHSFTVAENIVYLIPVNKAYNSDRMMREIWAWGGVKTILVIGSGGSLNFPIGFCIGAVHFQRGYRGGTGVEFYTPNSPRTDAVSVPCREEFESD
jgi:hypothetical protein